MEEASIPATEGEEEEDDEEEMMTSAEVLAKLEEAWRNEKFAPDLLEAKTDLIDCISEQVHIGVGSYGFPHWLPKLICCLRFAFPVVILILFSSFS